MKTPRVDYDDEEMAIGVTAGVDASIKLENDWAAVMPPPAGCQLGNEPTNRCTEILQGLDSDLTDEPGLNALSDSEQSVDEEAASCASQLRRDDIKPAAVVAVGTAVSPPPQ